MGDSITAATLSDLPIPVRDTGPEDELNGSRWFRESREAELQPEFIFENKKSLSWSSGRRIRSHYELLKRSFLRIGESRAVEVLNVAFPGDRTGDLPDQARKVVDAMTSGDYSSLVYVTLLIGSNDACAAGGGVPLAKMRANLLKTFRILSGIRQDEAIRVLLVGIPRIPDLAEPLIREHKTYFGLSCRTVRNKILDFCNPLLLWETADEYHQAMEIVEDRNRLLREVVAEVGHLYPNIEVIYSNRLYNLSIPVGILAADCFHPGRLGQEAIAAEIWLDQPWFY